MVRNQKANTKELKAKEIAKSASIPQSYVETRGPSHHSPDEGKSYPAVPVSNDAAYSLRDQNSAFANIDQGSEPILSKIANIQGDKADAIICHGSALNSQMKNKIILPDQSVTTNT